MGNVPGEEANNGRAGAQAVSVRPKTISRINSAFRSSFLFGRKDKSGIKGHCGDFISGRVRRKISEMTGLVQPLSEIIANYLEEYGWNLVIQPRMRTPRIGAGVAATNQRVFVAGGKDWRTPLLLDSVEAFDFEKNRWISMAKMKHVRCYTTLDVTPDGTKLYACGGYTHSLRLGLLGGHSNVVPHSTVEVYDFKTCTWSSAGRMTEARWAAGSAISPDGSRLFILGGGYKGRGDPNPIWDRPMNSAEFLDLKSRKFKRLPRMHRGRVGAAAIVSPDGHHLYVVGGDRASGRSTGEVLDLKTMVWTQLPPSASRPRVCLGLSISPDGSRLYVFGGSRFPGPYATNVQPDDSAECFNLRTWMWEPIRCNLNFARHGAGFCLSDDRTRMFVVGGNTSTIEEEWTSRRVPGSLEQVRIDQCFWESSEQHEDNASRGPVLRP
ncbi:hypothetical protein AAMO2058_000742900 [Amorphochlora amoebiformis]